LNVTAIARRSLILAASALVCLAVALTVANQAESATLTTCKLSSKDKGANKYGPSYLRKLKVKSVSCTTAKSFVKAYYKCRTSGGKGKAGKCTKKVNGYSCTEKRSNVIPTSFDAKVSCKNGSKRIYHEYQQLL
jgi:hypothetical protein